MFYSDFQIHLWFSLFHWSTSILALLFCAPYRRSAGHAGNWFFFGSLVFIFFAGIDYHKFLQWSWLLYAIVILMLLGLFFNQTYRKCSSMVSSTIVGIGV
jgi:predicted signal transduction protein with EAL and GGDEF domain